MINTLLRKTPLPVKLTLIGLIPLAFLFYFALEIHKEKTEKMEIVDKFISQVKQSAAIITLIDNLQIERRYTFAYSISKAFKTEMILQRSKTDEALQQAQEFKSDYLENFRSYTFLDELAEFRKKIDTEKTQPQETIEYYSNAILRLNSLAMVSSGNVSYLDPLVKELHGQRILSQMITYLGIVRATYYYSLYTKDNPNVAEAKISSNYQLFHSLEKEFFIKSTAGTIAEYKKIKATGNLSITLDVLNFLVSTKTYNSLYEAELWWDLSAKGIDAIKVMQRKLVKDVLEKANAIYIKEEKDKDQNLALIITIIVLVLSIVLFTIKNISEILHELKETSEKIAVGITGHKFKTNANDVIGSLINSIRLIDKSNIELSEAAHEIGKGNFDIPLQPRSKNDLLGNALYKMKADLHKFTLENEEELWMQNALSQINDCVRGEKNTKEIGIDSLATIIRLLDIQVGAFYNTNSDFSLEYISGYGINNAGKVIQKIAPGETQLGQAAVNQKPIHLVDIPHNYLKVQSSTGESVPRHIIIIPLVYNKQTEGVMEFASLTSITSIGLAFVNQAAVIIATALQVAKNRDKLQELLEETQAQSEELQTQHNEMESLNAELEAQAQKLQASEEELKVQQEELLQTNSELEEQSALLQERNAEVLTKVQELALTTKYKSEFLANMSHELRTPLNSILLLSRLLADNNNKHLDAEEIEYAQVIQTSGNGLLVLINEILDLSKIETGKMDLEMEQTNIKAVLEDLRLLFNEVVKEKNIQFKLNIDNDTPAFVETDKMRLEQVLKNLISNAIKFTSEGYVSVTVKKCPENSKYVCFNVKDTGIGIPKEKHALIFEAFQQADGSTKRKYGGTGLGLSISKQLVKLLQGEITLSSEPGKGSEFTVYIPIKIAENSAITDNVLPIAENENKKNVTVLKDEYISANIPHSIGDDRDLLIPADKCILIVEDDVNFAKSLLDYTRKRGYKGIITVRGDEALSLAKKYMPKGILLDIQLPVKSGWEVMDELKKDLTTKHIPVHIMSSHQVKRQSLLKGAVDFINKPVALEQMQEIFKKIEYVLTKSPKKVLIVEDNTKHAYALSYFLETHNIHSEVKNNISESMNALKLKDSDCVILDMGIPANNAYEVLEQFKEDPTLENIPIIIFTGKSLSVAEEQRIKKYADTIVVKTAYSYQRMLDEVSLFLHHVEEDKLEPPKNSFKKLGTLDQVLNGKTVLITDDDVRNIFSLTKALENLNLKVVTATNGKEALQKLEENPAVNIVLLDMMMPEMDGYETAKRIRADIKWKNLPVIAVTAKAMTGDREKCISAGASDYISKPVDIDQLLSLLRVWLYDSTKSTPHAIN